MFLVSLLVLYSVTNCAGENSAEYYRNIWDENVERARTWVRPTRNVDFDNYTTNDCRDYGRFDFIIIGAGSAGSVLANRLSEENSWSILVMEAGGDETDYSTIPKAFPNVLNSDINWGYLTTPQEYSCLGTIDRQCDFARGKVLGGSSSVNAMLHIRGNRKDFDRWEDMGNNGWSFRHVLPYFKKAENATLINVTNRIDRYFRGYHGPHAVSYADPPPLHQNVILKGNEEFGYRILDYNGKQQMSASKMQVNIKNGRRFSTNQAYLQPAINRRNLKVLTRAMVVKILFSGRTATGVNFLYKGRCFNVYARKEVILSAGAVNSPQLLMLSGIGPKNHLQNLNISVRADLPVGQNLQDHTAVFGVNINTNRSNIINLEDAFEEFTRGRGFLSYADAFELNFQKIVANSDNNRPDVELLFNLVNSVYAREFAVNQAHYSDVMDSLLDNVAPSDITFNFVLLHPRSMGEITLQSNDPLDFPLINPNYLAEQEDVEILYQAIQNSLELLNTESFKSVNATLIDLNIDQCNRLAYKERWICRIRHMTQGIYHPTGTCRMGNSVLDSVVDEKLIVHGFKNLRVIDGSIVPNTTSGHMNSVIIMIAEKMADEIKKLYSCKEGSFKI